MQAAIRAGYSPNCDAETAYTIINYPYVRAYIDKAMAERSKRTGVTAERVVELARLGFVNARDLVDMTDGSVLEGTGRDDTAAIASVNAGVEFARRIMIVDSGMLKPEKLPAWYFGVSEEEALTDYLPASPETYCLMLTPEQIQRAPLGMVDLYATVELDILRYVAKRINAFDMYIPAAQYQVAVLEEMGALHSDILAVLSGMTGKSRKELAAIMGDAVGASIAADNAVHRAAEK